MFNLATCPWSLQKCKGGRGAAYHQSNFLLLLTSYTLCCNYLWLERPRLHKYVTVLSFPFHFICVNMCSVSLPCSFPLVQPCSLCFSTHSPHLCFSTPLHLHHYITLLCTEIQFLYQLLSSHLLCWPLPVLNKSSSVDIPACCPLHLCPPSLLQCDTYRYVCALSEEPGPLWLYDTYPKHQCIRKPSIVQLLIQNVCFTS